MQHASQDRQKKATKQAYGMIKVETLLNLLRYTVHYRRRYWCQASVAVLEYPLVFMCNRKSSYSVDGDLYLISSHLYRCLRMIGVVSLHWGRMTRFHVDECAVAATSRPWQKKTVVTRTAAQNPRPRSRQGEPATWRPRSHPSQRWPRSSECVLTMTHYFQSDKHIIVNLE